MTQTLTLKQAGPIVLDLVETINANRAYLSEIDGLIGDGDHGINMSKGFTQCGEALRAHPTLPGLAEGLDTLAMTLLEGIGGSMGPLYGSFFMGLAETLSGKETLDAQLFSEALANGVAGVETVGSAKVGDKTLMDTLVPARDAFQHAAALTVRTLQRPDVWAAVERVAGELEQAGTLTHGLRGLLPAALPDWPPGGAAV